MEYVFKIIFTILGGFDVYIKSSTYHIEFIMNVNFRYCFLCIILCSIDHYLLRGWLLFILNFSYFIKKSKITI